MALLCDAVIGNVQEKAMKKYQASNNEVVFYSYTIASVYLFIITAFSGILVNGYTYLADVSSFCFYLILLTKICYIFKMPLWLHMCTLSFTSSSPFEGATTLNLKPLYSNTYGSFVPSTSKLRLGDGLCVRDLYNVHLIHLRFKPLYHLWKKPSKAHTVNRACLLLYKGTYIHYRPCGIISNNFFFLWRKCPRRHPSHFVFANQWHLYGCTNCDVEEINRQPFSFNPQSK